MGDNPRDSLTSFDTFLLLFSVAAIGCCLHISVKAGVFAQEELMPHNWCPTIDAH